MFFSITSSSPIISQTLGQSALPSAPFLRCSSASLQVLQSSPKLWASLRFLQHRFFDVLQHHFKFSNHLPNFGPVCASFSTVSSMFFSITSSSPIISQTLGQSALPS